MKYCKQCGRAFNHLGYGDGYFCSSGCVHAYETVHGKGSAGKPMTFKTILILVAIVAVGIFLFRTCSGGRVR